MKYIANIENGKQNPSFDILSAILHALPLSLDSVINPNLSEAERECRELESIYFACPPEMQKNVVGCHKVTRNPFDRTFRTEQKHLS